MFNQSFIGMPSLERCLPKMMMSINNPVHNISPIQSITFVLNETGIFGAIFSNLFPRMSRSARVGITSSLGLWVSNYHFTAEGFYG